MVLSQHRWMQREKLKKLKKFIPKLLFTALTNKEKHWKQNSETSQKIFSKNLLLPLKPILKKIKIKSRKTKTFTTLTGLEKKRPEKAAENFIYCVFNWHKQLRSSTNISWRCVLFNCPTNTYVYQAVRQSVDLLFPCWSTVCSPIGWFSIVLFYFSCGMMKDCLCKTVSRSTDIRLFSTILSVNF